MSNFKKERNCSRKQTPTSGIAVQEMHTKPNDQGDSVGKYLVIRRDNCSLTLFARVLPS